MTYMRRINGDCICEAEGMTNMFFDDLLPIKNMIEDFFSNFPKNRPIIVFGGGFALQNCLSVLRTYGMNVVAICDNDKSKQNTVIDQLPVLSLEDGAERFPDAYFVISSPRYFDEIKEQLSTKVPLENICDLDFQNWHYFSGTAFRNYIVSESSRMQKFYNRVDDDISREVLYRITKAHFSGKREDFANAVSTSNDWYLFHSIMKPGPDEVFVDCGAYDGDTVLAFAQAASNGYERIYALEPDSGIQKKLQETIEKHSIQDTHILKLGAYSAKNVFRFHKNDVYSKIADTNNSFEKARQFELIHVAPLDELFPEERISMIKMDIEGAEFEALKGAEKLIKRCRPRLAICMYHNYEDFIRLEELILEYVPDYKIIVRQHEPSCTDTILYAY